MKKINNIQNAVINFHLKMQLVIINLYNNINYKKKTLVILLTLFSILTLLQGLTFFYQEKFKNYIKLNVDSYNKDLEQHKYKLSYSKITSNMGFLGIRLIINDIVIRENENNSYIKTDFVQISCNILSCLNNKIKIKPDISLEFKIKDNEDIMLISFQKSPIFIVKNNTKKLYLYNNMYKYSIFNLSKMQKITSIDSSVLIFDRVKNMTNENFKIYFNFESKDLFNLDYASKNDKTIFFDTGILSINLDLHGNFIENGINVPDVFNIMIKNFHIKTSEFKIVNYGKIKTKKSWDDLNIDFNIDIYNFGNFLDYMGTGILNLSQDSNIQLITKKIIPQLHGNYMKKITNHENNKNVKLHITNNSASKDIYINKKPLKLIIFDLISNA